MKRLTENIKKSVSGSVGYLMVDHNDLITQYNETATDVFVTISEYSKLPDELNQENVIFTFYRGSNQYICIKINAESSRQYIFFSDQLFFHQFPKDVLYKSYYKELMSILDCITDGVYVTDKDGTTLLLNQTAAKSWSLPSNLLVGKNIEDLFKLLYKDLSVDEIRHKSVCLSVIDQKKPVSMIQSGENDAFKVFVTGTPYFENGRISKVVSTERNVTELMELQMQLEEKTKIASMYEAELEHYRSQNAIGEDIIIENKQMKSLFQLAYKIAKQDTTILLQGESGTGKEVFAKFIHKNSPRAKNAFIDINCAAIPDSLLESELFGYEKGAFTGANEKGKVGLFELANKGTLFMDEIGELPLHLQSKILRAVQEKRVQRIGGSKSIPTDVRIISATNINLKDAVEHKRFREDLYYRLNVVKISIPPLRERNEDILFLINHNLKRTNADTGSNIRLASDALNTLLNYEWPGNIRELSNVIEALVVTCDSDIITSQHLNNIFPDIKNNYAIPISSAHVGLKSEVENFERKYILSEMSNCKSSQELSNVLQVDKSTLLRKMNRYGIRNTYYK